MKTYSAYLVGPDGHIANRVDIVVGDDEAARECAKQLVGSGPAELWAGDRKIAEFRPRRRHAALH
jgi:hypothetical protein